MDGMTEVRISGGEGRGTRLVRPPGGLAEALLRAIGCAAHLGLSFPTRKIIGSWMGISDSAVSAAMRPLQDAGTIQEDRYGNNYRYRVMPDGKWTEWRDGAASSWVGATPEHMAVRRAMLGHPAEPAGDEGGTVEVEGKAASEGATLVQEASGPIAGLTGHVEVNGKAAVEGSTKFLGPTCEGKPVAWADLTLAGTVAVTGKVTTPRSAHAPDDPRYTKDFLAMLRDRRETLKIQRVRIDLAIEHMDGLLHILAPESDTSEVEKKA